jgi:hypothetical protein
MLKALLAAVVTVAAAHPDAGRPRTSNPFSHTYSVVAIVNRVTANRERGFPPQQHLHVEFNLEA